MSVYMVAIRRVLNNRRIITYIRIDANCIKDAQRQADDLLQKYNGVYTHIRKIGTEIQYSRTIPNKCWKKDF